MTKDRIVSKHLLADVEALADDLNGDMEDGVEVYFVQFVLFTSEPNPVANAAELLRYVSGLSTPP